MRFFIFIFSTLFLYAQNPKNKDSDKIDYLGEIVISSKIEEENSISSKKIKKEKLEHNENISSSLERYPSLTFDITPKGGANIHIRAFSLREIPVLIDGVPVYMPFSSSLDLSKIKTTSIEFIKISRGLSSVLYGPNSMGGAINIVTQKPKEGFSSSIWTKSDFRNNHFGALNLFYSNKKFYFGIMPSFQYSDGYRLPSSRKQKTKMVKVKNKKGVEIDKLVLVEDGGLRENSDRKGYSVSSFLGYNIDKNNDLRISWHHIYEEKSLPIEENSAFARYWKFPKWKKDNFVFLGNHKFKNHKFKSRIFYDSYYNVLQDYKNKNSLSEDKWEKNWNSVYDDYSFGAIFNYSVEFFETSKINLLFNYKHDTHRDGTKDQDLRDYERYDNNLYSFAAEYSSEFDYISIIAGLSFDIDNISPYTDNPDSRNLFSLNPQIKLTYWINDNNNIFLAGGKKTKFPSLKELFSGYIDRNVPNPDLKEEKAIHTELGFSHETDTRLANVNVFYSTTDDIIENINIAPKKRQLQNNGLLRSVGVELIYHESFMKILDLDFNYTYQYLYNKNNPKNKALHKSNNLLNVSLAYNTPIYSKLILNFNFTGKQYELDRKNNLLDIDAYTRFDLKYIQKMPKSLEKIFFGKLELFLEVKNIFDNYIYTSNNFPLEGREIYLGISHKH